MGGPGMMQLLVSVCGFKRRMRFYGMFYPTAYADRAVSCMISCFVSLIGMSVMDFLLLSCTWSNGEKYIMLDIKTNAQ